MTDLEVLHKLTAPQSHRSKALAEAREAGMDLLREIDRIDFHNKPTMRAAELLFEIGDRLAEIRHGETVKRPERKKRT